MDKTEEKAIFDKAEEKAREERLFYEKLDLYEKIVGRSAAKYGAEGEREYLSPDGGFVKNCISSILWWDHCRKSQLCESVGS